MVQHSARAWIRLTHLYMYPFWTPLTTFVMSTSQSKSYWNYVWKYNELNTLVEEILLWMWFMKSTYVHKKLCNKQPVPRTATISVRSKVVILSTKPFLGYAKLRWITNYKSLHYIRTRENIIMHNKQVEYFDKK